MCRNRATTPAPITAPRNASATSPPSVCSCHSGRHSGQQVTAAERHSGHGGGGKDAAVEEDRSIVHVNLDRHRLTIRPEVVPGQVAAALHWDDLSPGPGLH